MITPAYALTATERVLPRLALDFTTAALDARVTVTRALNTATRINSSGYVETVNADLPRFDFTLNTGGVCKGLLIEESRVNIIQRWSDFTQTAVWNATSAGGASAPTNTGNTTLSPDGVNNAQIWSFTAPVSGDRSILSQTVPSLATGYWASTIFMKAGRAEDIGKIISIKETQGATYTLVTLTNQWQRPESINTSAATTHGMAVELRPLVGTSTGTVQVAIWGAQTEAGAFVTSAIPNTGTGSVTRNADVVSMTGTNFSDWFNATAGSIYAQGSTIDNVNFPGLVTIGRADFSTNYMSILHLASSANVYTEGYVSGALQFGLTMAGTAKPAVNRAVLSYAANSFAASTNAGTVQTDNTGSLPTVDELKIGRLNGNNNYLNGHMQKVMYWPQRLIDAETRAFSK